MTTSKNAPLNVFDYFDYREYLEDVIGQLKKTDSGFSYRLFAQETGIPNHNYLLRIIKKQRNLTARYIPNISAYLKHTRQESQYFDLLVQFNNAKRPSLKERLLRNILSFRYSRGVHILKDSKLKFFSKWYYPVIRELVCICDFQEDYNLLARKCVPRITPTQARGAVKYLVENGFVRLTGSGKYVAINQVISTEPEVDSAIIPKYHRTTIAQCAEAVETIDKEVRSFSSLTLRVSRETYEEMKREIASCRRRLLTMAKESRDPELICFAGFQLMPRSEIIDRLGSIKRTKGKKKRYYV
jgi:uncharacterized protein (TIGR02147 family)